MKDTLKVTWIENLRAIACVAVIILHVSGPWLYKLNGVNLAAWSSVAIIHSFTRFCVPVFLMITGALLLNKETGVLQFYRLRLTKVLWPLLFWSTFYIIIFIFFDVYNGKQYTLIEIKDYTIRSLTNGAAYHLWYMYLIIALYFFIPFVTPLKNKLSSNKTIIFLLFWLLILLFAQIGANSLVFINIRVFVGYFGYLILGSFISELKLSKKNSLFWASALILIGMIATFYPVYTSYKNDGYVLSEWFYYLNINVVLLSMGVFLMIKNIELKWGWLSKISQHSFGIYFIHLFYIMLLNKVMRFTISIPIAVHILLFSFVVLLLSYISIYLLKKVPLINRYIE